jgi:hypothetical protein
LGGLRGLGFCQGFLHFLFFRRSRHKLTKRYLKCSIGQGNYIGLG